MTVTVAGAREVELVEALAEAFTPEDLEIKLADPLRIPRSERSYARALKERAAALVRWAKANERVEDLLRAALRGNPSNASLRKINEACGLLPSTATFLWSVAGPSFEDRDVLARRLAEVQRQVCGLVSPGTRATAFLVGPDQIMTHALALQERDGESLRELDVVFEDVRLRLHPEHPIVMRSEGACVLRLDRDAGRALEQANANVTVRARGWIVPNAATSRGPVILVMYADEAVRVAWDVDGFVAIDGNRIRYRTSSLAGSGGAPCFDASFRLLGMHVGTTPGHQENEGRTVEAVIADLRSQHFEWDASLGVHSITTAPHTAGDALDGLIRGLATEMASSDEGWSSDVEDLGASAEDRWAWAEAAAVQATFDPGALTPLGDADEGSRVALLLESRQIAGRWMMPDRLRRAALERLANRGELTPARARSAGDPNDPVDAALGDLIAGVSPRVDPRDPNAVRALSKAVEWLHGLVPGLPDRDELRATLERSTLLAPFRHLTRGFFAGREAELEVLAKRVARRHRRPLFIHAAGGMGKSALLAHFVLANSDLDPARPGKWRPFVYLDFDRPDLDATDLGGVLLAIARQLGQQVPALADAARALVEADNERRRSGTTQRRVNRKKQNLAAQLAPSSSHQSILRATVQLLAALPRKTPIVLILDTLEEVQFSSPDAIEPLIDLTLELCKHAPHLRPLLAGRVPPESGVKPMELGPLASAAAEALLSNELPPSIAMRTHLVTRLAEICRGNPLSLRLAAEVVRSEAEQAPFLIDELGRELEDRVGDAIVQGRLYERILGHIHEPRVRALAHPGLVLRRVTWELIRDVLAGPCGLGALSDIAARQLFDALAQESALVSAREGEVLELRPELRRVVLEDFAHDATKEAERRAVHAAAVAFYAKRSAPSDRAEEIYHRLALGEDPDEVDKRWMKGIKRLLRSAVGELPAPANAYLSNRIGGAVGADEIRSAKPVDWEEWTFKRAGDLLKFGQPRRALELLESRTERLPTSRLHYVESIARRTLSDLGGADAAAERAVQAAQIEGDSEQIRDALEELILVRRLRGDTQGVLRALARLGDLGDVLGDDLVLLQSEVEALEAITPQEIARAQFTQDAVRVFNRLPDELVAKAPELSRRVAAQVGGRDGATLQRVIRLVGTGSLDRPAAARLHAILEAWRARDDGVAILVPDATKSPLEIASAARYLITTRQMDTDIAHRFAQWLGSVVTPGVG